MGQTIESDFLSSQYSDSGIQPTFVKFLKGHGGYVSSISSSKIEGDGDEEGIFCSSGWDNSIRVWSISQRSQIGGHMNHSERVFSVDHSPKFEHVASGSQDGSIVLWDYGKASNPIIIKDHTHRVWSVKYSKAGSFLLSTSGDKTIRVYDLLHPSGAKCSHILTDECEVQCGMFDNDARQVITGGADSVIRLWDLRQRECVQEFKSHKSTVYDIDRDRDFKLVSGSKDTDIHVHDIRKPDHPLLSFNHHRLSVYSVRFSPGGWFILSGSKDKSIKCFSLVAKKKNKKEILSLDNIHGDNAVTSLDFTSDGKYFLSGGGDGNIALWESNSEETVRRKNNASAKFMSEVTPLEPDDYERDLRLSIEEFSSSEEEENNDELYIFLKGMEMTKYYEKMKENNISIGHLETFLRDPEFLVDFIDVRIHRNEFIKAARERVEKRKKEEENRFKDEIQGEYNWDGKSLQIKRNHAFFENQRHEFEKLTSNVYKIGIFGQTYIFIWDDEDEMLRVVKAKGEYEFIKRIKKGSDDDDDDNTIMMGEYDWNGKELDIKKNHVFLMNKRFSYEKVATTVYSVELANQEKYVFNWDREDEVLGIVRVEGDEFFEKIKRGYVIQVE